MQEAFLDLNGVPTHVTSEGRWVEAGLAADGHRDVVVVIPGNPGLPSFYNGFIKTLNSKLPTETPVWMVGHAGHVQPSKTSLRSLPKYEHNRHLYNLDGQLKHKAEFIKKYVPKDARLHLVAHSIGSWFVLNLLKDEEIRNQVVKCYLLFPTIERMAESPNGKFFTRFATPLISILVFLSWIFTFLPLIIQILLIEVASFFIGIPRKCRKSVLQLVNPAVLRRVFSLAKQELEIVRELDHELVSKNSDKLWLYYGSKDGWTPVKYYEEIRTRYPNLNAVLCKRGILHSFVLESDTEMGNIVADIINDNII
ncbi:lipid droplet-associated hydrolase [Neodiprion lecontei]|uniref:Lipid droplet-associated hydrolase n=1 Tax=Neodiprion lecontei TaxID=441921 RepID=A0A6J0BW78_NEOLC|nr:lipid droplet-associated hydrolase [Neodiprion lecontei]XP_046595846.1 lipid droplet-associated hydrolase [Neodiprion lecontei]